MVALVLLLLLVASPLLMLLLMLLVQRMARMVQMVEDGGRTAPRRVSPRRRPLRTAHLLLGRRKTGYYGLRYRPLMGQYVYGEVQTVQKAIRYGR